MKTFISQIAEHYAAQQDRVSKTVFIFPNHRALLHFRSELKRFGLKPYRGYSINDFFQKVTGVQTSDRIHLLLTLYECYKALNEHAEPLDEFIHWGGVMLSDFDNIDKYLVDAPSLFVNVSDFRSIQDTYEYLTENQRRAIEHFVAHFRDRSGRLTVSMTTDNSEGVKQRFLSVWNILAKLYRSFNETLEREDMAYEGRIYRSLANKVKSGTDINELLREYFPGAHRFVFAGLNALNECEKTVLGAMRDAGKAEFVWDFSSKELKDPRNKASFFLSKNIELFPQAFPLDTDQELKRADVRVVSVSSSVGQTKLAAGILNGLQRYAPEDTVFVLPDETLLMPLLSAIPAGYDTINVTMGYPMDKSAIYSLLRGAGFLQLGMRMKDGQTYFHHTAVSEIFSSSLFKAIATEKEHAIMEKVKTDAKQYIPVEDLNRNDDSELLTTLFSPIAVPLGETGQTPLMGNVASAAQNHALEKYLKEILSVVTKELEKDIVNPEDYSVHADMELEFSKRYDTAINELSRVELDVLPGTYLRLLDGFVKSESVPFEGDALKGLQVMGTLETRALDFRNVVILSANEDLFPHRSADNSFIPPELRKGFGLPTLEYQDAVWAYYFYRLIQRAENVWLVYDSRTEGLLSGEESRYIKQLEYHFRFPLKRYTAVAPVNPTAEDEFIDKTQEDIDHLLNNGHLSASALQSYLACPAKFYYQAVKGLKSEEDVTESPDASMLGTIFHSCMEKLYKNRRSVTVNDLRGMLADEPMIRGLVAGEILDQTRAIEIEGRNLIIEEVLVEYVRATLKHDLDLLVASGEDELRIIGLERYLQTEIDGFKFVGFADRIDSYKHGEVRIVDYKTGHVENDDILITDGNAASVVEKLFGKSNTGRPKIALQMFLYDNFAKESILHPGETVVNSIYSTAKLLTKPLPDVAESQAFSTMVEEKLHGLLSDIKDTSKPWKRTNDTHCCALCDFRSICGR